MSQAVTHSSTVEYCPGCGSAMTHCVPEQVYGGSADWAAAHNILHSSTLVNCPSCFGKHL